MPARLAALALLGALCASGPAVAYNEALHALLTSRVLAAREEWRGQELAPPSAADLATFRALFWRIAAELPDAALRAKWLQRFPTSESLDAWSFKELFMLDPAATVHGFDLTSDDARPMSRMDLIAQASRWPDDDERNRNRFFRDAGRQVVKASDGTPMPYDPATLALGGLTGTTSQGHAHYGLLAGGYSDEPDVLKTDPRHFALPKDIRAYGQDFAQLYADLALLAEGSGLPAAAWLSVAFAGASFHHLEDVANQIHTVQVGTYQFFRAAWLQSKRRDVVTLGGLLGRRRSLEQLGLRLVANHHLFSEDLFARRVQLAASGQPAPAEVQAVVAALGADDPQFAPVVAAAVQQAGTPGRGELARRLADALVEVSSTEGPEIYELAFHLSAPSLRDGVGHEYRSPGDDPDAWIARPSPQRERTLARFWPLEGRGLTRAGTVVRAWQRWYEAAAPGAAALRSLLVHRTLALLLPYHDEAAARRAKYVPPGPARQSVAWGYPGAFVALTLAIGVLVRRSLR